MMLKRPVTYVLLIGPMVQDWKFAFNSLRIYGFSSVNGRLTHLTF